MNSLGYLILITALLVLAGLMLYARFATRSREKSLHHAPFDWGFGSPALALPSSEGESRDPAVRAQLRPDRASGDEEASAAAPPPREYLDELQEAAAGLAKLMRSSPAARPDPVVYAPPADTGLARESASESLEMSESDADLVPEASEGGVGLTDPEVPVMQSVAPPEVRTAVVTASELSFQKNPNQETDAPLPEAAEADSVGDVLFVSMEPALSGSVSIAIDEGDAAEDPAAPGGGGLRERLGDVIVDQLDHIDAGLDALGELVAGIEENLRLLADYERVVDDSDPDGEDLARVAAAA